MSYTLYYSPGACSLAVHIALEELAVPFELKLVSTTDGSTRSDEYLRINPKGRVPALVFNETTLTEAPAILMYLGLAHPTHKLMPTLPEATARCAEWFNWLSGSVHAVAVRQIWRPESFTADQTQHESIITKGKSNLDQAFVLIEQRMNDRTWVVDEAYSLVDPYLFVFYRWGNRMGVDMRTRYPAWTRHALLMLKRNAVQRALAQENISVWE